MKTGMKSIFLLGIVVLMAACNSNQKKEESHEGHDHSQETPVAASSATTASVNIKDDKLNAVYQHYIHLTTALTSDNTAEAKVAASAIEIGAKQIDGGATLAKAAAEVTESKDIEAQRTIFASLSNEFISLLKKTGLDSGELYISHCPMALNDKGADWVSNSKEIRNPYFGESMLTCGSVKETIK